MVEDQQRSFCRKHRDAQVGVLCDALPPNPGGVDHHLSAQRARFSALMIVDRDAMDAIALPQQTGDFAAGEDRRAMFAGIEHIRRGEAERIDGAVGNLYRAEQRRVNRGLNTQRFGGRQRLGFDTCLLTGADKGVLVRRVIFRQGNKQAAGGLYAVAGDTAQYTVFANALAR